jgi:hypothetical protein
MFLWYSEVKLILKFSRPEFEDSINIIIHVIIVKVNWETIKCRCYLARKLLLAEKMEEKILKQVAKEVIQSKY